MTKTLRLDLPLLLPDVPDTRDACVARLESMLGEKQGIRRTHLLRSEIPGATLLCLHYDPDTLSLAEVERIAAGAEVTAHFGHAVIPLRAVDGEDAGRRIEDGLLGVHGVLSASVNLAAQRARLEFDREVTSIETIKSELARMGYASGMSASTAPGGGCCRPREAVAEDAGWYARNKELRDRKSKRSFGSDSALAGG
ncbi:MAG: heavy-metal-associated domain-containing protein [Gemmatimonadetes bacterium]|nr:heavy-metal-associated domain-containing protein [Gemmatimonadota bacterium]